MFSAIFFSEAGILSLLVFAVAFTAFLAAHLLKKFNKSTKPILGIAVLILVLNAFLYTYHFYETEYLSETFVSSLLFLSLLIIGYRLLLKFESHRTIILVLVLGIVCLSGSYAFPPYYKVIAARIKCSAQEGYSPINSSYAIPPRPSLLDVFMGKCG